MREDFIWRDDALTRVADDLLGTSHVAHRTARLIAETHSFDSSTVVGLIGPWGSGKSSILGMCCETLEADNPDWVVGKFTPWATSDSTAMMADFYSTLTGALPADKAKDFRRGVGRLVRVGTAALKVVPVIGDAASDLAGQAADQLLERPSWDAAFTEAAERLRKLQTPVLIVVDDVDRLQRDELVNLLKVIRLLGRFPGVTYLLAYDEQTLFANLQRAELGADSRAAARLFMEKVVQYPVPIPPLLPSQVVDALNSGLGRVLDSAARGTDEPGASRLSHLVDVFRSQLTTPRSINRYIAQVQLTLSMHDRQEIDEIDVVMLTLLRVQFPDLYAELPRWRVQLTGGQTVKAWTSAQDTIDFTPLLDHAPAGRDREDAGELVSQLFPVTGKYSLSAGTRQSIREADYFNRYFVHTVPADDIRDADINEALKQPSTPGAGHQLITQLLSSGPPARRDLAIRRLWTTWRQHSHLHNPMTLLGAVMGLWGTVPEQGGLLFDVRDKMTYWAADLLTQVAEDQTATTDEVEATLDQCHDPHGPLNVLWAARGSTEELGEAVTDAARRRAERCLAEAIDHLQAGDDADLEMAVRFRLMIIEQFGDADAAAQQIHAAINHGVSVETLASRCVTVAHLVGVASPAGRLNDFDQDLFARFAPPTDDLYSATIETDIDHRDLSWQNRRAYVRGRAKAPTRGEPEPSTPRG